jgi:hypothetical protein
MDLSLMHNKKSFFLEMIVNGVNPAKSRRRQVIFSWALDNFDRRIVAAMQRAISLGKVIGGSASILDEHPIIYFQHGTNLPTEVAAMNSKIGVDGFFWTKDGGIAFEPSPE